MCLFIETMKAVDGIIENIEYHNRRLNATRRHFWHDAEAVDLQSAVCPPPLQPGVLKARIVYGRHGISEVTFTPYAMRNIRSLRLVDGGDITYTYKSTDRTALNRLAEQRGGCDDVLIMRHGLVTDTSFANIAFYDGTRWKTPQQPLLKGTRRAFLLDNGIIAEADIRAEDIGNYRKARIFNAMIDFGQIEVENII